MPITDGSVGAGLGVAGVAVQAVGTGVVMYNNYSDTGNVFIKGVDHAENSKKASDERTKEWKKKATVYEKKLDNCIKSHGIDDFDATVGQEWNREDIKEQLIDCHQRIKKGENFGEWSLF
ncbi:hypothetical protein N5T78_04165 [Aliarcobacter cryaerophilus]|uniref:hypothetical protein n=1 Tax=Aliarcobacter cryaerophilus TaxID=28198 RepID=UPI0021B6BCCC|nr:hypothetical protein [Aliarcobacter cryaerophilus]MCT7465777.1 hypothetical protein [Aliarcobacter cryaerophilus]